MNGSATGGRVREADYTPSISLPTGSRLGAYEVISALGVGGMGEVYRARDTRLNRDVAIKVLLPAVANDPDRLARFSREAQVLASLNHPNIAAIYGIEEGSGITALVMELVEGEDLAQRIARGPIPIDEALPIARQIADALEAAHDHGIIHRDLKPANIKVRADGTVKMLDFGLAKALGPPGASATADAMNSPTLSIHATEAGLILGTASYMSPEQAAGKNVDKRTDLWAFGIVLMEMLIGRQVFKGETVSHVIAAVLTDEPGWAELPADTPLSIRRLLRRCLEKDRKLRLPDAAVARLEIDDARTTHHEISDTRTVSSRSLWPAVASFVVGGLVIGGAMWMAARTPSPGTMGSVVRFAIYDTDEVTVSRTQGDMALSPDGRTLAFVGFGKDGPRIWVREFDSLGARALPGTEAPFGMAWSPDGRSIAFASYGRLRKVVVAGGSPEAISPPSSFAGGVGARSMAWGPDGTIFFADNRGFWRATADGGIPATLAMRSADEAHDATGFLPDGRHFLLSVASSDPAKAGTFVVAVDGSDRRRILAFPSWAQYAMGRLIFVRDQILYAQPFDTVSRQLSGAAVPLAESAADRFSVSNTGSVAYLPLDSSEQPNVSELVWMDRRGGMLGRIDQAAGAISPTLSPDGRRLAMVLRGDIWTFELARSVMSKVTTERAAAPTWSPDGKRILFYRSLFTGLKDAILDTTPGSGEKPTIALVPADGTGDHAHPNDISADGRYLAYEGKDARDIWVVPLTGDRTPRPFIEGPNSETQPIFSPDGRWLAYSSDATGAFEVYVQRFPASGARIQVSPGGGGSARWSRDGTELFYLAPDGSLTAVPVRAGETIEFGQPKALFKFFSSQRGTPTQKPQYDVTADGKRFIVSSVPRRNDPSIQVLLNWPALNAAVRQP